MPPFFSIVVPTFNSESSLPETLRSIEAQDRNDVEVLIIDGGSHDQTVAIARTFGSLVSTIVSERDNGIYDAVNKGIKLAKGSYINILGSDDVFCNGTLDLVHHLAIERRSALVAGAAIFSKHGQPDEYRVDEPYGIGALVSGIPFCHNALFVHSEAYQSVGRYSLDYRICADAQWVHRAIRRGLECSYTTQALVRFSLDGLSSTATERLMDETYSSICENFAGLKKDDAEVLFKAVRGWTSGSDVPQIVRKYRHNTDLVESLCIAFLNRADYLAGLPRGQSAANLGVINSDAITPGPIFRRARKIAGLLRRF
jgi:glycosyltransferase involved in cell wall biosynthesis